MVQEVEMVEVIIMDLEVEAGEDVVAGLLFLMEQEH
jgi:hypothetical protein